jgi:hypothetical protein
MYDVTAMSTPYGIVESPTNNWPKFAILNFAPKAFRYSLIGLLALNQNHQKSWPVIPTLKKCIRTQPISTKEVSYLHSD